MKKPRGKRWPRVLIIGLICLTGVQFIRPRLDNPMVTGDLQAPAEVKQVLKRACYDCHSNETKLAWFDELVPAYWMVVSDIKEARKVLNFSRWDSLTGDQQKGKLFEAFNKITFKEMPLESYRLLHGGAAITDEEAVIIRNYLHTLVTPVTIPDSAKMNAAYSQCEKWVQASVSGKPVAVSPNGIGFMPDYKDWVAISTTDRIDNGTMRVIMGNDQAVKAIKERHTNPWPDGAAFAKIAWDQSIDSTGNIHTGLFKQVEFMIRDGRKYASSDGWGWARWVKGSKLVPYGKDALFVTECMSCHKPMQDRDFVFTSPLNLAGKSGPDSKVRDLYNEEASLPEASPLDPLEWKVITSAIDQNHNTMSTLYGNDIAVKTARTSPGQGYSAGAVLSLVTWSQKEDKNWHGGQIPASIRSIEKLDFGASAKGGTAGPGMAKGGAANAGITNGGNSPLYEYYTGTPLKKTDGPDAGAIQKRIAYILGLRASVMPSSPF